MGLNVCAYLGVQTWLDAGTGEEATLVGLEDFTLGKDSQIY